MEHGNIEWLDTPEKVFTYAYSIVYNTFVVTIRTSRFILQ